MYLKVKSEIYFRMDEDETKDEAEERVKRIFKAEGFYTPVFEVSTEDENG